MMRNTVLTFLVTCLMIFLALAGAEELLRVLSHESKGAVKYKSHPSAVVTMKPHLEKKHNDWGPVHYYRTNEIGVRDDEELCEVPDILVFGDSNIFARFLPFGQTLGEQLEDKLGGKVCAVNFGVPGYGPDQNLLRMLFDIDELVLKPKVMVFHVFADNDFGDIFRNYLVTLDESGKLQTTDRNMIDYKLRTVERLQARYLLVRRLRDLVSRAGLYRIPDDEYVPVTGVLQLPLVAGEDSDRYIQTMESATLDEFKKYQDGMYTTWLGDKYDYAIALDPEAPVSKMAEQLLAEVFREAKLESDRLNSCLVVLIQPSETDFGGTGLVSYEDLMRYSNEHNRSYRRRNLTDLVQRAAESSGVDSINLFDVYETEDASPYVRFEEDKGDNHWNAEGVKIAAEKVSQYVIENRCMH